MYVNKLYTHTTEESIVYFKKIASRKCYSILLQLNQKIIDLVSDTIAIQVSAEEIFQDDAIQIVIAAPIKMLLAVRVFTWWTNL